MIKGKIGNFINSKSMNLAGKISLGVLAALVIAIIGFTVWDKLEKDNLAEVKVWEKKEIDREDFVAKLNTKFENGLKYIFVIEGESDFLEKTMQHDDSFFNISFRDEDGFNIDGIKISVDDMTGMTDSLGNFNGLYIQGFDGYFDQKDYQNAESWNVVSNVFQFLKND